MQQEYSVFSGDEEIGKVFVERLGLYYRIRCRFALTGDVRYRLLAECGENRVDLGLCVPQGSVFGVNTKIPIKRLGEGELHFRLMPKHQKADGKFVPVKPDEPFSYIRQLQNAHLAKQDGHLGIVLPENQNSRDKPTGQ